MTDVRSALQQRLRERRYAKGSQLALAVLESLGVTGVDERVLPLDEVELLWHRYLARMHEMSGQTLRWPATDIDAVRAVIDLTCEAVQTTDAVWFALIDSEPVGIEVPAAHLLRVALTMFVSSAGDLMLVTRDATSGICLELNHLATGDVYEVIAWGLFAVRIGASEFGDT